MEKVVRDGRVAVLVSPGYGAGWSTWNDGDNILFDPGLVNLVLAEDYEAAKKYAEKRWPRAYLGGLEDLVVEWVDEGAQFRINEYDGYESLVSFAEDSYQTA